MSGFPEVGGELLSLQSLISQGTIAETREDRRGREVLVTETPAVGRRVESCSAVPCSCVVCMSMSFGGRRLFIFAFIFAILFDLLSLLRLDSWSYGKCQVICRSPNQPRRNE
jgi:hypothetical protein